MSTPPRSAPPTAMIDLRSVPRMTEEQERLFLIETMTKMLRRNPLKRAYVGMHGSRPPDEARIVPQIRFTMVVKGCHLQRLDLGHGPQNLAMKPGDVLFMPPGTWRVPLWEGARVLLVVLFSRYSIRCSCHHLLLGRASVERARFVITPVMAGADASLLNAVEEYGQMRPPPKFYPQLVQNLMQRVIAAMQEPPGPTRKSATTFAAICDFMRERFREPLSRETVADALRIHPAHVSRLFRTMAETTFQDYLQEVRIEYARGLLKDASMTFKEVAVSSGFRDADHFRDVFRKRRKESPQAYRDAAMKAEVEISDSTR